MSLRARLLIGLVAIAAVGLLVAGFATYRAERSFLVDRVKQQLILSVATVEDQVAANDHLSYELPQSTASGDNDGGDGGEQVSIPPGQVHPPGENLKDPPGTFGEHLNASGKRVGTPVVTAFEAAYAPAIPKDFRRYVSADPLHPNIYTASAIGDPSETYLYMIKKADVGYGYTVVAVSLGDTAGTLSRLQKIEAIVIAAVLVALAALAWLVIRIGLRPLERIAGTAGAIAAGDLSQRVSPADGRTEVGRLGLALNAMLGQIEQAFARRRASEERLRRFLSDASHELRTPLTSIRGYAELFRIGATASPEDTAKAMARIEEEAARMGVLVEDLLALARLDEMPQTTREPVDLVPLVRDAGEDARAVARDREVRVVIEPEPRAPAHPHVVSGDPHQLRQVLANLVSNALKHTPAGTPIEITLRRVDALVRIEVRDHGPGLPDDAGEALFERFWRAEGGRERGRAGAGLGLAIVAEIVAAHGGTVSARNSEGGGAVFVVELGAAGAALPPPRF